MSVEDWMTRALVAEAAVDEARLEAQRWATKVAELEAELEVLVGQLHGRVEDEDEGDGVQAPWRESALLLREFALMLERKRKGWAVVLLVKDDGTTKGYAPEARGLRPERVKAALAEEYEVVMVGRN